VKGIYKKAREGKISDFTGISAPYEVPGHPEITINSGTAELNACVQQIIDEIMRRGIIPPKNHSDKSGKA
jgi:adenylylsulfate kinase